MDIFTTILAGVSVFVAGQILLKIFIEPIQKLKESIAEVVYLLTNDHAIYHNAEAVDKQRADEAYKNIRNTGAVLNAKLHILPFYFAYYYLFGLPSKSKILKATDKLFGISNKMYSKSSKKYYYLDLYRIEICELLKLDNPIKNGLTKKEILDSLETMYKNDS